MMEKDGKRPNLIEKGLKMMENDGKPLKIAYFRPFLGCFRTIFY